MKYSYFNKKTRKGITAEEYDKLSDDEKQQCVPYRIKSNGDKKPRDKDNDYKWYEISEPISKAVGSIPFNRFPGVKEKVTFNLKGSSLSFDADDQSGATTPGVLTVKYIPSYGNAAGATAAINVAARAIYTFVRHQNSGRTNYEAPDLMLYIMAMDQIYTAWYELRRLYDAIMTYTFENRYIPDALIYAMAETTASNYRSNLADFRYRINLLAAKISSLCVPKKFDIFKRHTLLAGNVFADSTSLRGQYYLFKAERFLKFSPTADTNGGSLQSVSGITGTPSQACAVVEALLDAVLQDEDMNIMSGDILKAYGRENLYQLEFVSEDETLSLARVENVLQQIENSATYGGLCSNTADLKYTITQNQDAAANTDRYLITTLSGIGNTQSGEPWSLGTEIKVNQLYFNSHKDAPDYKDVIEWSRSNSWKGYATEIITSYVIYYNNYNEATGVMSLSKVTFGSVLYYLNNAIPSDVVTKLSSFDWHPIVYLISNTSPSTGAYKGKIADLKVYTLIELGDIQQIHDAAINGALGKLTMTAS